MFEYFNLVLLLCMNKTIISFGWLYMQPNRAEFKQYFPQFGGGSVLSFEPNQLTMLEVRRFKYV